MPAITQGYYAQFYEAVDELSSGREGTPLDMSSWHREYRRNFLVIVKRKGMSEIDVCRAPLLPLPASFYVTADGLEYDLLSRAYKFSAKQRYDDEAKWHHWVVTVEYSTKYRMPDKVGWPSGGGAGGAGGASNDPTLEPIELEFDFERADYYPEADLDGKLYASSAWQQFNPAVKVSTASAVVRITRNEIGFSLLKAVDYAFTVNELTFLIGAPNTVMCLPPKAKYSPKGPLNYFRVSYVLLFGRKFFYEDGTWDLESWQPKQIDKGTMELVEQEVPRAFVGQPLVKRWKARDIKDGSSKISKPVLLDGQGKRLQPRIATSGRPVFDPVYINFRQYPKRDFKELLTRGLA